MFAQVLELKWYLTISSKINLEIGNHFFFVALIYESKVCFDSTGLKNLIQLNVALFVRFQIENHRKGNKFMRILYVCIMYVWVKSLK